MTLLFSSNEWYNYSEAVGRELLIPWKKVQDGSDFEPEQGEVHYLIQNPAGMRGTAAAIKRKNPQARLTGLMWERVSGKHERNNYGKELLLVSDLYSEIGFTGEDDVAWGRKHGIQSFYAGVAWIGSECIRRKPWGSRQNKFFWCGTIYKWWHDDLARRIEIIDYLRERDLLVESDSKDPKENADMMATCKWAICPEGHCGYQSHREFEAALAGTMIVAYEGEKETRWPFGNKDSIRINSREQMKDLYASLMYLSDEDCRTITNQARSTAERYLPDVTYDRILASLENLLTNPE